MSDVERGISMTAWSVGRILAGAKSQTRRPIKPQPSNAVQAVRWDGHSQSWAALIEPPCKSELVGDMLRFNAPYGPVGRVLYVKEALAAAYREKGEPHHFARYAFDDEWVQMPDGKECWWKWRRSTLNARFMPKKHARLWLRVTDIRAERVGDISRGDAIAEGIQEDIILATGDHPDLQCWVAPPAPNEPVVGFATPQEAFREPYDSIYAARGQGFDKNDWVWAYTFERTERKAANE